MTAVINATTTGTITASITASTISFTAPDTIADSGSGFGIFSPGDYISISGSATNDGNYIVSTASAASLTIILLNGINELDAETAGSSITIGAGVGLAVLKNTNYPGEPEVLVHPSTTDLGEITTPEDVSNDVLLQAALTGGDILIDYNGIGVDTASLLGSLGSGNSVNFDYDRVISMGKHGSNSNDGASPENAVLDLDGARAAAAMLIPTATDPVWIVCVDGGTYNHSNTTGIVTQPDYVHIRGPMMTLTGAPIGGKAQLVIGNNKLYINNLFTDQGMGVRVTAPGVQAYTTIFDSVIATGGSAIEPFLMANTATGSDWHISYQEALSNEQIVEADAGTIHLYHNHTVIENIGVTGGLPAFEANASGGTDAKIFVHGGSIFKSAASTNTVVGMSSVQGAELQSIGTYVDVGADIAFQTGTGGSVLTAFVTDYVGALNEIATSTLTVRKTGDIALNTDGLAEGISNLYNKTHTGDVTGSSGLTIGNDVVDNAKAANMPALTMKGNDTVGIVDPKDLTVSEIQTLLGISGGTSVLNYAESEAVSSTSGTTPVTKVTFTTASLISGDYYIFYSCEASNTGNNDGVVLSVDYSGTVVGQTDLDTENPNIFQPFMGFKRVNISGVHTVKMDFSDIIGGSTANIRRARIYLAKVL